MQLAASSDTLTIDEDLRIARYVYDGSHRAVRIVPIQHQLFEFDTGIQLCDDPLSMPTLVADLGYAMIK